MAAFSPCWWPWSPVIARSKPHTVQQCGHFHSFLQTVGYIQADSASYSPRNSYIETSPQHDSFRRTVFAGRLGHRGRTVTKKAPSHLVIPSTTEYTRRQQGWRRDGSLPYNTRSVVTLILNFSIKTTMKKIVLFNKVSDQRHYVTVVPVTDDTHFSDLHMRGQN